ncbi:MAG: glycosyltransferase family 61 protein [Oceanospirillales bacterium]|nr:glycosyltransferase family 61 protein [Oceanospirillales bacterium]MBR9889852.1 glycosyltransferase family 61 protein [Oceanospirillales bacterium]
MDKIPHIDISVSNYATGFLRMHNDTVSLIKLHDVHDLVIESAYFLGGNGSENYYHWMVELLPKLQYIATKSGFERCANIVVSSRVLEFDSFKKTLVFSVKGFKFNIYYLDKKNTYRIRKLLVITKPSDVLFNSKNVLSRVDFCFYRKSSIDYTVKLVEDIVESNELDLLGVDFFERVFIGRMPGLARSYNQDEIEELLVTKYGFTTVFLENYSIEEQFMIFKKAKCIAGPSGAAWTNLMFCNKNSVLISWLPDNISDFSVYSSLSSLLGLNMFFVEAEADCVQELHTSYYLSPVRLARLIDEVLM